MEALQKPFPINFSGRLQINRTKTLAKLATLERQRLVRPDCFDNNRNWYRVLDIGQSLTAIKVTSLGCVIWSSHSSLNSKTIKSHINQLIIPVDLPDRAIAHLPTSLAEKLNNIAPLVHIASASLEEAIVKAIIRQVISAGHAKTLIHRFITRFGECYEYEGFLCYRFPTPERIIASPLEDLISCGLGFKAKLIKSVIEKLEEDGLRGMLGNASINTTLEHLQGIKGIGQWTAHITVSDITGDWSLYPFDDLAVRTWASKLWPNQGWPQSPKDFRKEWESINGIYVGQVTFYLLALAALLSEKERR
jgi:DNA-3-methyladenine glycosylase II